MAGFQTHVAECINCINANVPFPPSRKVAAPRKQTARCACRGTPLRRDLLVQTGWHRFDENHMPFRAQPQRAALANRLAQSQPAKRA